MLSVVRWFYVVVVTGHGLLHFLGAADGLGIADIDDFTQSVSRTAGFGWLAAGLVVLFAAGLTAANATPWWWSLSGVAAVVSQSMISTSWNDAMFGSLVNGVLLIGCVIGFYAVGPMSLMHATSARTMSVLSSASASTNLVTEADLRRLPPPVAKYVRRSGAVGRPTVTGFSGTVHGRIRSNPGSPWMDFVGRQLTVFSPHLQRIFSIEAQRSGIPAEILHDYNDGSATMRGRIAGLFPFLKSSGPELDKSETVTVFNDMVLFAPAALIDANVRWTVIDDGHVRAEYTGGSSSVSAELEFNDAGDLTNFLSEDRYRADEGGRNFELLPWSTPVEGFREYAGRRVSEGGRGMWHAPEGAYTYIEFHMSTLVHNPSLP